MAVRGRKPKPNALKALEGNPGKRPLNTRDINTLQDIPRCPAWLEKEAKKEWKRMGRVLGQMGMLTELDMTAFAGYCQSYARWKAAEEYITDHGSTMETPNGYVQQIPQVSIAQTNLKIMLRFCEQFGLTPSVRSRMLSGSAGGGAANDDMEQLLGGDE